jgi:hypothetical protein
MASVFVEQRASVLCRLDQPLRRSAVANSDSVSVSDSLSGRHWERTKSRQWETQRISFSSARATVCPPAKVNGVWPWRGQDLRPNGGQGVSQRGRRRRWPEFGCPARQKCLRYATT